MVEGEDLRPGPRLPTSPASLVGLKEEEEEEEEEEQDRKVLAEDSRPRKRQRLRGSLGKSKIGMLYNTVGYH